MTVTPTLAGLRFYARSREVDDTFAGCFAPLFDLWDGLFFYGEPADDVFAWPWEEDEEDASSHHARFLARSVWVGEPNVYGAVPRIVPAAAVAEFASLVSDDWNAFTLAETRVPGSLKHLTERVERLTHVPRPGDDRRVSFFRNFDGCFWEVFTNDPRAVPALLRAHGGNPAWDLRAVTYPKHAGNPGRFRPDEPPPVAAADRA